MKNKKTILFDFDGTLANSLTALREAYNQLAHENGYKIISKKDIQTLRSKGAGELIKILGIPKWKIPFLVKKGRTILQKNVPNIQPIPGIIDVLTLFEKQNVQMAILSSNSVANIKLFLKNNHLSMFTLIDAESSIFGKANAIKKFLKKYAIQKDSVIYVGDEIRDIEAAHAIGIKIISVTWGLNNKEGLLKYHPDFLVDDPNELKAIIKNIV